MNERVSWRDDGRIVGDWGGSDSAHVLIGHDYGGTYARTGIYIRQRGGSWTRARVGSVRHEGKRERIDAGIAEAVDWVRRHIGTRARVRLGVGCKGPTDTRTGDTDSSTHFSWGAYNVVEHYSTRYPRVFERIVAGNDLMVGALGAALDRDVQGELRRAIAAWNRARRDAFIRPDDLHRDVAVISLGTGAGYKVIHRDGRVGDGGEIWTLYAPIDRDLFNWLWARVEEEESAPAGRSERYRPNVEMFVSGSGLAVVFEFLQTRPEWRLDPETEHAIVSARDVGAELSRRAHAGCPTCRRVFVYLAAHLAALAQQVVQAHKPRSIILSGGSLIVPNWDLMEDAFFRYFRREFDGFPVEFPLVMKSRIGLVGWARRTAVAVDRSSHPGVDGAAYLALHAEFYAP